MCTKRSLPAPPAGKLGFNLSPNYLKLFVYLALTYLTYNEHWMRYVAPLFFCVGTARCIEQREGVSSDIACLARR
jgi:hypothetical protein